MPRYTASLGSVGKLWNPLEISTEKIRASLSYLLRLGAISYPEMGDLVQKEVH